MKASRGGRAPQDEDAPRDMLLGDVPREGELPWLPLNALRAFDAVGRRLSFTGAAAALRVSQSSLSRHVARLEQLLGRRLLERRPHGLALTEAGAALLPVVHAAFERIHEAMRTVAAESGGGPRVLRVHMPPSFLHRCGLPLLAAFQAAFPDISVDVSSSNGTGLPASGEVDVAVVYDRPQGGGAGRDLPGRDLLVRDLLWMVRQVPACAPALAERAAGMTLGEFLRASVLLHVKHPGEPPGLLWDDFARHQNIALSAARGLAFETAVLAVQCALDGGGVVLADPEMFAAELREGRLVAPYPVVRESGYGYYLAVHPEDMNDPAVAALRSWMISRFARAP